MLFRSQYSKEDYEKLVAEVKTDMKARGEWGKFFPLSAAGFGYNASLGQIYFPLTKEEVLARGGLWHEFKDESKEGVSADTLPDRIDDVPDSITSTPLICPVTKQRYNIAPRELAFCREYGIPLPRRYFDFRMLERFKPLAKMVRIYKGVCAVCGKEIEHYYPPEFGYKKIACVDCYQKAVA